MAKKRYQRSGRAKPAQRAEKTAFTIESIDPLAQGVSRDDKGVCFIAKTLPGETGQARIMKRRSSVRFAQLESLETESPKRVEPDCPHYASCPACHFLHTDYASELEFKQSSLLELLQRAGIDAPRAPELIAAPRRLHYRNRVQLHYRHKHIGMIDAFSDQVLEIPQCKIIDASLQVAFDALYEDKNWHRDKGIAGHCEIYHRDGETNIAWDQDYAQGGFTQVYSEMNEVLKALLQRWSAALDYGSLLDLFAGDGNLSDALIDGRDCYRAMVDYSNPNASESFYALDLYADDARQSLRRQEKSKHVDFLLLDPPRKGLPELSQWLQQYRPQYVFYVSCNPATLVRDLKACMADYQLTQLALLDLFPGTQHYETVVALKANKR